jgi:methyl-accepting chemotaxis protein/methyl-accepting chemotaxis protein-1 (serine sensor receptor)
MKEINAPHEKISKIVRVVDEIAFHTNILALHAAMETARAAEAGMGLAVAAGEERNLAHRRAQAAKDTAALIEESIAKSTEGNKKLPLVAGSIQQVTDSATPVKALLDEVDVGSQRPSRAIEQIAPAVTRLEVVSQRSAARAEQSAAANEELAALAQTIYGIAERVRQRVGGNSQASTREVGPRRSPAPTAPAASHTADLGALDRALRQAGRTKVVAPAPIARRSPGRDAFPLDDTQNNF